MKSKLITAKYFFATKNLFKIGKMIEIERKSISLKLMIFVFRNLVFILSNLQTKMEIIGCENISIYVFKNYENDIMMEIF